MEPPIQTDFISMVVPMQVLLQHATGRFPDVVVSMVVLMSVLRCTSPDGSPT